MADALYHGSELGVFADEGVDISDNYGHPVTNLDEITVPVNRGRKLDIVFMDEIADIPDQSEIRVPVVYGEVVFGRGTCINNYTEPVTKELVEYAATLGVHVDAQ